MKLDRIHQIAEIIASVAIVASLIFVGLQVSQNTDALETNAAQINAQSWQTITLAQATSPQLAEAWRKSFRSEFDTSAEETQLMGYIQTQVKSMEFNYLQWRDGKLSDEIFDATRNGYIFLLMNNPVFERWATNEDGPFSPDFVAFTRKMHVEAKQRRAALDAATAQ